MHEIASILRFHTSEGQIFDRNNDSVVVTRNLLNEAADEIERLRGLLREVMNHECAFPDDLERRIEAEINEQYVETPK